MKLKKGDRIIRKKNKDIFFIEQIYTNRVIIVKNTNERLYFKIKEKDMNYFIEPDWSKGDPSFLSGAPTWSGYPNKNIFRYFYKPNEIRKMKLKKLNGI